mgnify:CR=1 FL=1
MSFKNFKIVSFIYYSNSLIFLISLIFLYFFTSLTSITVGRNCVKIFKPVYKKIPKFNEIVGFMDMNQENNIQFKLK